MKTQIKVTDTRMHKITIPSKKREGVSCVVEEVPVVEAELVLVQTNELPKKGEFYVETAEQDYKSYGFALQDVRVGSTLRFLKLILISKTEKIEVGEMAYAQLSKQIFENVNPHLPTGDKVKILALPEHFSPKHLQAIVDGKMKEGDKVLVQCESEWDDFREENNDFIKLNSSNHITLYKKEEKMYTREEVRKILRFYVGGILPHTEEWFEQNVK